MNKKNAWKIKIREASKALLATIHAETTGKGIEEDAMVEGESAIRSIEKRIKKSKAKFPYSSISALNSSGKINGITVVHATIGMLSERNHYSLTQTDESGREVSSAFPYSTATFIDPNNVDEIRSAFITDPEVMSALRSERDAIFELTCALVKIPKKAGISAQRLLVLSAIPLTSPLQLLMPSRKEIQEAEKFIQRSGTTLFKKIKDASAKLCHIHGLNALLDLNTCVDFAILMAFSDGRCTIDNTPAKIHLLVVGPPGVGKKLVAKVIETLSCTFRKVHSSRVTAAGLSAATSSKDGSYISKKGALPLAHLGSVSIEDIQHVSGDRLVQIYGILAMAMEDGMAINSTAANSPHPTRTAIHLDINRQSHLHPEFDKDQVGRDLNNIPNNLLTRIDLSLEIPHDTERQLRVASSIIQSKHQEPQHDDLSARTLKIAIALLQDRHQIITIPKSVAAYIQERIDQFSADNRENFTRIPEFGNHLIRTSVSIKKIVHAHARAHNRSVATEADVEAAFRFVSAKFDFLRTFSPDLETAGLKFGPKERRKYLVARFKGKKFSVKRARKAIKNKFSLEKLPELRTTYRDLEVVAKRVGKGIWTIREQK